MNLSERAGSRQGAVSCSVNKAAQTVSIFLAADFFFCTPEDDRDCFTTVKVSHGLQLQSPMGNPYCSCML